MSQQQVDEETPLLQPVQQKKARTPLPWRQFSIILFLQLAEPLTSQVIAPFTPQVWSPNHSIATVSDARRDTRAADKRHWHHEWRWNSSGILCWINGESDSIDGYTLILKYLQHSLFFATQALTVLHWSRISDHIGRKPVILTGLFGLSISMYCFGLSRTFWGLVLRFDHFIFLWVQIYNT